MNHNKTILLKALIIILIWSLVYYNYSENTKKTKLKITEKPHNDTSGLYDYCYDYVIEKIKNSEGFRDSCYFCPAGKLTIGYGHVLKENESYVCISKSKAESILKDDFERCIQLAKQHTKLLNHQVIPIAHFIYCLGIGTYLRSGINEKILNGENIEKSVKKYCMYRSANDSTMIESSNLKKNRELEVKIYYMTSLADTTVLAK